jgi:hypothetical protein
MKESRTFERITMERVPNPIDRRTVASTLWPVFQAIIALPETETHAIKLSVKGRSDCNMIVNKLRKWAREHKPQIRIVANRADNYETMYLWWVER